MKLKMKLLIQALIGIGLTIIAVTLWSYNTSGLEFPNSIPEVPWTFTIWLIGIITLLLIPLSYCLSGES